MSRVDFEINTKQYSEYLVFENLDIIQDKKKLLSPKKVNIEKFIVNNFLVEPDLYTSLIILKNECNKIYQLSEAIRDFIQDHSGEKMQSISLINYLNKKYSIKIPQNYLNYLLEIVRNYFKIEIPKHLRVSFF